MVNFSLRSSTKDQSQRKRDDDEEEENLDQRCNVFEPSKDLVWEEEDDEAGDEEDGD